MSKRDSLEDYEFRRDEWAYREHSGRFCTICGGPEPCSKRACLDALLAQADYAEGSIEGSDWKLK